MNLWAFHTKSDFSRNLDSYCLKSFLVLLNTTALWINYLVVKRLIIWRVSSMFLGEIVLWIIACSSDLCSAEISFLHYANC